MERKEVDNTALEVDKDNVYGEGDEMPYRPYLPFKSSLQLWNKSFKDKEALEDRYIKFDWERREEYFQPVREYWQRVSESDGFDIEGIPAPPCSTGLLMPYDCIKDPRTAYPSIMVKLYAHLGLHRYNMLEGTNFKLEVILKFNRKMSCASSYYITLDASEYPQVSISNMPSSPPQSIVRKCFQVRVDEICPATLNLNVSVARPKGTSSEYKAMDLALYKCTFPGWPSDFCDSRRFYVLNETELYSIDWITLYFKLLICSHDRSVGIKGLVNYELVSVAIESIDDVELPKERIINAKKAYLYITYKHLDVICKAMVRRIIDESGNLILRGALVRG